MSVLALSNIRAAKLFTVRGLTFSIALFERLETQNGDVTDRMARMEVTLQNMGYQYRSGCPVR